MAEKYFTEEFLSKISEFTAPLSKSELETYIKEGEESVLLRAAHGVEPQAFLNLVENIGVYLRCNSGSSFTSDYQSFKITDDISLWSFQLPGGGNLNVFDTKSGKLIIDTGYGCFFEDCRRMAESLGLGNFSDVKRVICTHTDADHCGASGYFDQIPYMHPAAKAIIDMGTRGFGSKNGLEVLEKFYTTTINTFSEMFVHKEAELCRTVEIKKHGLFSVIDYYSFDDLEFEVWESLGGHIAGQIFLYEPKLGILFTSDALLNFSTFSKARAEYSSIADAMIGSVNVFSDAARTERYELMRLAKVMDDELKRSDRFLLIVCGHGLVSRLDDSGKLVPASDSKFYSV